jgi:pilus assembly protein CpaC
MSRRLTAAALLCLACAAQARPVAREASPAAVGGPQCGAGSAAPERVTLAVGKTALLQLADAAVGRSNGNPAVALGTLLSPHTLYVLGIDVGGTNMVIQGRSGRCVAYDFIVQLDPAGLQAVLAELMPEETGIRVTAAADSLVLSGTVADATVAERVLELAAAFVRKPLEPVGAGARQAAADAAPARNRVINLLAIAAPQQVMLEVKVAEVSKSLLERLDIAAAIRTASGSWTATLASNVLAAAGAPDTLGLFKHNGTQLTLEARKQDGLVRILAEPTVLALSGQEGSFLAGGKLLIPVGQDNANGGSRITLEEKEFGVGLKFTPTVLAGGRINLRVAPEVSELSRDGVGLSAAGVGGRAILPLITTRRASTTVQLYDGQSFAIGGLIKNNTVSNVSGLPLLGEIPVLGALFRSTDFQADRSELVFIVTPHLVKPLPPAYPLPTDGVAEPGRAELFLGGRQEGRRKAPAGGFELD